MIEILSDVDMMEILSDVAIGGFIYVVIAESRRRRNMKRFRNGIDDCLDQLQSHELRDFLRGERKEITESIGEKDRERLRPFYRWLRSFRVSDFEEWELEERRLKTARGTIDFHAFCYADDRYNISGRHENRRYGRGYDIRNKIFLDY